jgi:hypothetical protein
MKGNVKICNRGSAWGHRVWYDDTQQLAARSPHLECACDDSFGRLSAVQRHGLLGRQEEGHERGERDTYNTPQHTAAHNRMSGHR